MISQIMSTCRCARTRPSFLICIFLSSFLPSFLSSLLKFLQNHSSQKTHSSSLSLGHAPGCKCHIFECNSATEAFLPRHYHYGHIAVHSCLSRPESMRPRWCSVV
ncbi:hypothetical protein SCHPADRAFT_572361 [Schizopora paradoxa]|uniref:Uncharacterized protein n=1 Tax=Schizopora paradoxa TaxID=27342 RepID=A0A0H2RBS5_9AGAM|nr:hypothetical protein SCHPADRAFT_572361 [Schizopora paradoxa]